MTYSPTNGFFNSALGFISQHSTQATLVAKPATEIHVSAFLDSPLSSEEVNLLKKVRDVYCPQAIIENNEDSIHITFEIEEDYRLVYVQLDKFALAHDKRNVTIDCIDICERLTPNLSLMTLEQGRGHPQVVHGLIRLENSHILVPLDDYLGAIPFPDFTTIPLFTIPSFEDFANSEAVTNHICEHVGEQLETYYMTMLQRVPLKKWVFTTGYASTFLSRVGKTEADKNFRDLAWSAFLSCLGIDDEEPIGFYRFLFRDVLCPITARSFIQELLGEGSGTFHRRYVLSDTKIEPHVKTPELRVDFIMLYLSSQSPLLELLKEDAQIYTSLDEFITARRKEISRAARAANRERALRG